MNQVFLQHNPGRPAADAQTVQHVLVALLTLARRVDGSLTPRDPFNDMHGQ